jgi:aldose 1-epimerase
MAPAGVEVSPFGNLPDGSAVERYTLTGDSGVEVSILTYGGIVRSLVAPDRRGDRANVVLGLPDLDAYVRHNPYLGCITGRYANRIAGGRFELDGVEHRLATNDPPNHLHGGLVGFDKVRWTGQDLGDGVRLAHTSPDGDEGYPGTLEVEVDYRLTAEGLRIDYRATTDAPTIVNLTNHSLFNLAGEGGGGVDEHLLSIAASRYLPVDATQIPTGELAPVDGTPMDFRSPRPIGAGADGSGFPQLAIGHGYDHTWVLDRDAPGLWLAARVVEPGSGRTLEVLTTEPGVQLYVGNRFDGTIEGTGGRPYGRGAGLALETQHLPDSPNHPAFPSTVLRPGERFTSTTVYRLRIEP